MFRILAFAIVFLAASSASAQWYPGNCPGGVCPTPQPQYQQFVPPAQYQQFSPVQQPPVQRRVERPQVVPFQFGVTYTHVSRREVRQAERQQRGGEPVHFNGTSRWSWPQNESLRDHMRLHGLSPNAAETWSRAQLQSAHDHIHFSSGRGTPDPNDVRYLR